MLHLVAIHKRRHWLKELLFLRYIIPKNIKHNNNKNVEKIHLRIESIGGEDSRRLRVGFSTFWDMWAEGVGWEFNTPTSTKKSKAKHNGDKQTQQETRTKKRYKHPTKLGFFADYG